MRVELYKLIRKKTTYLLCLPLLIPLLYGIGLNSNLDLVLTQDGQSAEFISRGIGVFEFIYTMIGTANFFFTFILVVVSSMLMAREIENKEIHLYVYRVGKRFKIVGAKFVSLQLIITIYYIGMILLSTIVYLLSSDIDTHGIMGIFDADIQKYIVALGALYLETMVISSFCLMIGTKLKAFGTFSTVFILYIISMYFDNFVSLQKLFPEHFAKYIAINGKSGTDILLYILLFIFYVMIFLVLSIISFQRKEL